MNAPTLSTDPYDALLVVSFGGPEGQDDVIPFLQNVTSGRNIPRARLEEVGEHYRLFGGRSPINDQNRNFISHLQHELNRQGISIPIYWGNRNWHPYLADELARMRDDGIERAAAFVTSAYDSYSGCRQYLENLADAATHVGPGAPRVDRLRHSFDHPGFITANADSVLGALSELPPSLASRLVGRSGAKPPSSPRPVARPPPCCLEDYDLSKRVNGGNINICHSWLYYCKLH